MTKMLHAIVAVTVITFTSAVPNGAGAAEESDIVGLGLANCVEFGRDFRRNPANAESAYKPIGCWGSSPEPMRCWSRRESRAGTLPRSALPISNIA